LVQLVLERLGRLALFAVEDVVEFLLEACELANGVALQVFRRFQRVGIGAIEISPVMKW
jgi:hypothetical protein